MWCTHAHTDNLIRPLRVLLSIARSINELEIDVNLTSMTPTQRRKICRLGYQTKIPDWPCLGCKDLTEKIWCTRRERNCNTNRWGLSNLPLHQTATLGVGCFLVWRWTLQASDFVVFVIQCLSKCMQYLKLCADRGVCLRVGQSHGGSCQKNATTLHAVFYEGCTQRLAGWLRDWSREEIHSCRCTLYM